MPRYDYRCLACNRTFEVSHAMGAAPPEGCVHCHGNSLRRLIVSPMINSIKSTSPTGAKYEKLSKREIIDMEAAPLAEMEQQEGMAEKLAIMYGGKLD
jgi:putative FmdB family regulatory protein